MADSDNLDDDTLIVDRVHDAPAALTDAIQLIATGELLASRGSRIVAQRLDSAQDDVTASQRCHLRR